MKQKPRDHGGGLDAAICDFGGPRSNWIDLSTGINPHPFPIGHVEQDDWTALPDRGAFTRLEQAARSFWNVPSNAAVLAAPGASALIARIPALWPQGVVDIPAPTYNEHAAAFRAHGWERGETAAARVLVHPNNPDGRYWTDTDLAEITIIDESFCDIAPDRSMIHLAERPNTLILKSFGKFWGLAGARLGFAIGDPALIARLSDLIGPWAVSGPALRIGAEALENRQWALETRAVLAAESSRLDDLMTCADAQIVGGTPLFRLYNVNDAAAFQTRLAKAHIWSRIFPYSASWIRLGLPPSNGWRRLEDALS